MRVRIGSILRPLLVLLCLAALGWTVARLDPRRVLAAAAEADPWWIALALSAIVARFLIWAGKWMLILRRRGPVGYRTSLGIVLAGAFVNLTTPTAKLGGGIVRSILLARRTGWPRSESYGWSLADQLTNLLGQWLLFALVAFAVGRGLPDDPIGTALWLSGLGVLAIVLAAVPARRRLPSLFLRPGAGRLARRLIPARLRTERRDGAYSGRLSAMVGPISTGSAAGFARDLALGGAGFGVFCLSTVMAYRGLGADVPLLPGMAAVMLGYLAGTLVGVWGGVGVTEAALTGLFLRLGLSVEVAATGALLHRACFYLVVLGAGGPALWWYTRTSSSRRVTTEGTQLRRESAAVVSRTALTDQIVPGTDSGRRATDRAVPQRRSDQAHDLG